MSTRPKRTIDGRITMRLGKEKKRSLRRESPEVDRMKSKGSSRVRGRDGRSGAMGWVKRSRPLIGRMRCGTRENEKCMRVFVGTWVRGHGGRAWRWRWRMGASPALGPHWAGEKEGGGGGEGRLGGGVHRRWAGVYLVHPYLVGGEDGPLYFGYGMFLGGSSAPESRGLLLRGHARATKGILG